jgi:hypothetical protein
MPYKFFNVGGNDNSYIFETDNHLIYDVKFRPSSYLFEKTPKPYINDLVFEFIIELVYKPANLKPPLDKKISLTVAHIFHDFFNKNNNVISIYFCDSSDAKQEVRMKKFNQWWYQLKAPTYIKVDEVLVDSKKHEYPISMILRNINPYKMEIIEAFLAIVQEQNSNK